MQIAYTLWWCLRWYVVSTMSFVNQTEQTRGASVEQLKGLSVATVHSLWIRPEVSPLYKDEH